MGERDYGKTAHFFLLVTLVLVLAQIKFTISDLDTAHMQSSR